MTAEEMLAAMLATLEAWRDSLPTGHQEKPGAIRSVEVLRAYGTKALRS
jgi:hypothetical protein